MKFRKLLPMSMLSILCLTSCGSNSRYGTYKFLLGKQGADQVRVGATMTLTNEKVVVDEKNYEKFQFKLDLGSMEDELMDGLSLEIDTDSIQIPETIEGYYEVLGDVGYDAKGNEIGNKMAIGFEIETSSSPIPIPNDLLRNLLVTYVSDKAVTLQVPVSITDLQMQLAWYGYYIDFDPYVKERIHSLEDVTDRFLADILSSLKVYTLTDYATLPGVQGEARFGSHPVVVDSTDLSKVKNEVYLFNSTYEGLFSNSFVYKTSDCYITDRIGTLYSHMIIESDGTIGEKYYYYPLDKEFDASHPFTAYMKGFNAEENRFIDVTELSFDLAPQDNFSISHILRGVEEIKLSSENYLQDPFVFRDFHDIKIALSKEN